MPSDEGCWTTKKELAFLIDLASRERLEFGRSRCGRNKIVDCARALAGYARAFDARANWQTVDRNAIREWLTQHDHRLTTERPLVSENVVLNSDYQSKTLSTTHEPVILAAL